MLQLYTRASCAWVLSVLCRVCCAASLRRSSTEIGTIRGAALRDGRWLLTAKGGSAGTPDDTRADRLSDPDDWKVDAPCTSSTPGQPSGPRSGDALPAWSRLFGRWANKSIALAGDSLMRNFHDAVACAATEIGADVHTANLLKFEWASNGSTVGNDTSKIPLDQDIMTSSNPIEAYVRRTTIKGLPRGAEVQVDSFTFWSLTSSCRSCGTTEGEQCHCDRDVVPVGTSRISKIETLVGYARSHDETVLNLGHDMVVGLPGSNARSHLTRKLESLLHSLQQANLNSSIVFMEHPAQHFPGTETGDYIDAAHMNHTSCSCNLSHPENQVVAQRNRVLADFCARHKLRIASVWDYFAAKGCNKHTRPPDCTHYAPDSGFWMEVADRINGAR